MVIYCRCFWCENYAPTRDAEPIPVQRVNYAFSDLRMTENDVKLLQQMWWSWVSGGLTEKEYVNLLFNNGKGFKFFGHRKAKQKMMMNLEDMEKNK